MERICDILLTLIENVMLQVPLKTSNCVGNKPELSIFSIIYGSKGKVGEVQKLINERNFIPLSLYVNQQVNFFIHVLNPLFHSVSLSGGPG
jgi:hypothetical protein